MKARSWVFMIASSGRCHLRGHEEDAFPTPCRCFDRRAARGVFEGNDDRQRSAVEGTGRRPDRNKLTGWAAAYDYDTFKKIEFDNGGNYRGKTEYIVKGTAKTLKSIAENNDLSNEEKATFMAEVALKFSRAMLDKSDPDAPSILKTFYGSEGKWGPIRDMGVIKIGNSEASADTIEKTHFQPMYESILSKLQSGISTKSYSDDDTKNVADSTQEYVGQLLGREPEKTKAPIKKSADNSLDSKKSKNVDYSGADGSMFDLGDILGDADGGGD